MQRKGCRVLQKARPHNKQIMHPDRVFDKLLSERTGLKGHVISANLTAESALAQYLITTLSRQDATLDGGAIGDGLIRVDTLVGLLAVEVVLDHLLHLGDTCGASNQHNLIDFFLRQAKTLRQVHGALHGSASVFAMLLQRCSYRQGHLCMNALALSSKACRKGSRCADWNPHCIQLQWRRNTWHATATTLELCLSFPDTYLHHCCGNRSSETVLALLGIPS